MSTPDPVYEVMYVPRRLLPHLPTDDDPAANLGVQLPTPFEDLGQLHTSPKVAITVLSMLDEPVEAVGWYTPGAELVRTPVIQVKGPPSLKKNVDGNTGEGGWIDPAGYDDLVSVGSWLVDSAAVGAVHKASVVLHLHCTESKVDILVGGLVAERIGNLGGWNPYNIALYEPGTLAAPSSDSVYDDFFQNHVDNKNGTWDDREGSSAHAPVCYLARTPQGRTDWHWRILLFLGPRPIKTVWDEAPKSTAAEDAARRAEDIEDWVQRLIAVTTAIDPDEPTVHALVGLFGKVPLALVLDVFWQYTKRASDIRLAALPPTPG